LVAQIGAAACFGGRSGRDLDVLGEAEIAIGQARAARLLASAEPSGPAATARWQLASDFLEDLRRLDEQMNRRRRSWLPR
jgi:hypothetical protein